MKVTYKLSERAQINAIQEYLNKRTSDTVTIETAYPALGEFECEVTTDDTTEDAITIASLFNKYKDKSHILSEIMFSVNPTMAEWVADDILMLVRHEGMEYLDGNR